MRQYAHYLKDPFEIIKSNSHLNLHYVEKHFFFLKFLSKQKQQGVNLTNKGYYRNKITASQTLI